MRREENRKEKRERRLSGVTFDAVTDMNALYKAQKQAARGVAWKASTQRYQINWLLNINKARNDLLGGRDVRKGFYEFDIYERGKPRHISSVHFSERVVHKSLSQNALVPATVPTLISRNSANIKDRGLSYALDGLKRDLVRHYRLHGEEGYILLMDYAHYFDSIPHEGVKGQVRRNIDDERIISLEESFIDCQGDVGLGLGSEPNQICAVAYPNKIDHFVTEMCGVEAYGRYMDDSYCIDMDKRKLRMVAACVEILCEDMGLSLHRNKTAIVKLSHGFTWLKKKVSYGSGGKIVMRPCRDSITRERRKLKALKRLLDRGEIDMELVEQQYMSWRGGLLHLDAHGTLRSMDALYLDLFGTENPPPETEILTIGYMALAA